MSLVNSLRHQTDTRFWCLFRLMLQPKGSQMNAQPGLYANTMVLDDHAKELLPDAIRRVCQASGMFITIEVPGLGRALIIREQHLGDLIHLFKDNSFATSIEQSVASFRAGRGQTRLAGVMPGDEQLPLKEPDLANSIDKAIDDFKHARGCVRKAGEFPA
jgi:hypothetical protein